MRSNENDGGKRDNSGTGSGPGSASSAPHVPAMERARPATVTVSAVSLALSALSLLLLVIAISTDHWYETDTRRHKDNCDRHGSDSNGQKNRDMPIYHLPLVDTGTGGSRQRDLALMKPVHVGSREEELLENWRAILGMGILETECGRPLFSTHSGLWRKCYFKNLDPDIDKLIDRGQTHEHAPSPFPSRARTLSLSPNVDVFGPWEDHEIQENPHTEEKESPAWRTEPGPRARVATFGSFGSARGSVCFQSEPGPRVRWTRLL